MSNLTENIENRIQEAVKAYYQSTKPNITKLPTRSRSSSVRILGRPDRLHDWLSLPFRASCLHVYN